MILKLVAGELELIAKVVYQATGIQLDASKSYLVETRLSALVEQTRVRSYRELADRVARDPAAMQQMVDAITTNETYFFRDNQPFELLRHKLLPETFDRRKRREKEGALPGPIRIWSAASSTGQEIYSIAMILKELLPLVGNPPVRLLATDISQAAIAQASRGVYNRFEVERGLPPEKRTRYFTPEGDGWKIRDELRGMVAFQQLNLHDSFASLGRFDIVFCRNVAIYFSLADRKKLFDRLADTLVPDGALLVGASEFMTGVSDRYDSNYHMNSVYFTLKKPAPQAAIARPRLA